MPMQLLRLVSPERVWVAEGAILDLILYMRSHWCYGSCLNKRTSTIQDSLAAGVSKRVQNQAFMQLNVIIIVFSYI